MCTAWQLAHSWSGVDDKNVCESWVLAAVHNWRKTTIWRCCKQTDVPFRSFTISRFPEITGEIIWKSEAPGVGQFQTQTTGIDPYSMISEWRWQSKSAGLWPYQTFRYGPMLYWTARWRYALEAIFFLLRTAVFLAGPHVVCLFGMVDCLNWLPAFIIYTVFLIKKKKCKTKKSLVASAASSVALHGLPEADHCEQRIEYRTRNSEASCSIPSIVSDCG